jgi:glyceraldehyde-3-phosphate dehydrogenase (ferredoxin)
MLGRILRLFHGRRCPGLRQSRHQHGLDKQFNEETIQTKQQHTCGEPCPAVCKKMREEFKKDYEPYQTMGPLCGIFDQRAAERLNHHADRLGFDAISVGGVLSWLMESLAKGALTPEELGVKGQPVFSAKDFSIEADSMAAIPLSSGSRDGTPTSSKAS